MRDRPAWRRWALHRLLLAGALLLATSTAALAHLMPAQRGTLNVLDRAVFAALSLPVSAFTGIDDNRDGRLSPTELSAHLAMLRAALARRVHFSHAGVPGRLDLVMPMAEPDERDATSAAGGHHVLVLMKATFAGPPTALRFDTDLFGTAASERQFTIIATRGTRRDVAVLSPRRHAHTFFRGPWQVVGESLRVGVAHILTGADHLLFLLTIIVVGRGWRYWLAVLTSFTVAHSLTLGLSTFDRVHLPARLVEPLIAATIVLTAIGNIRAGHVSRRVGHTVPLVFGCGLVHGLGFASALEALGVDGANRLGSVIGFNAGIELGQAVFLIAVLLVNAASGFRWPGRTPSDGVALPFWDRPIRGARALSWFAAVAGTAWCVQRLLTIR